MSEAVASWNVDDLMFGGVVTSSWQKERLSEECGPIGKEILWKYERI